MGCGEIENRFQLVIVHSVHSTMVFFIVTFLIFFSFDVKGGSCFGVSWREEAFQKAFQGAESCFLSRVMPYHIPRRCTVTISHPSGVGLSYGR